MRLSEEGLWDRPLGQDSQMASAGPSTWHSPGLSHPSLDTCINNERSKVNNLQPWKTKKKKKKQTKTEQTKPESSRRKEIRLE